MSTDRLEAIRSFVTSAGDDAFLLTAREDIRWTCGFSGSSGALLVTTDSATLFTDGRYTNQAADEARNVDIHIYSGDLISAVGLHSGLTARASVGIDGTDTTVATFRRIQAWPAEPQIQSYDSPFALLVATKDSDELRRMRRAQEISDAVFAEVLNLARPGMTERELAAEIVYQHLKRGAGAMSFDPIVASGENGALPHARPTGKRLTGGDMVVLDFGCFFEGYASDMTRTICIGKPSAEALRVYGVVQEAQRSAQECARSGIRACDLDRKARSIIEAAGLGSAFTHSLGHGVGLRIHEFPRISSKNKEVLPEGAVVTIEPGVYIPGQFGVRIENAVLLHPNGCEALPTSSTELIVLE